MNRQSWWVRRWWPVIAAIIITWAVLGWFIVRIAQTNDGHFIYFLDDAYIHMAIAKNIALHGVWGVTPYEFTSASSSLLWTLLLSGVFFVFGVSEHVPLALNILLVATLLFVVDFCFLRKYVQNNIVRCLLLLALNPFLLLEPLAITGMEHVLQAVLVVLFFRAALDALAQNKTRRPWVLPILGLLLAVIRYEDLLLVLPVCALFILRKRSKEALTLGVASFLPLTVFGLISLARGSFFLPNSIIVKSLLLQHEGFGERLAFLFSNFLSVLSRQPHLLFLLIIAGVLFWVRKLLRLHGATVILAAALLAAFLPHVFFIAYGGFRYNTYLITAFFLLLVVTIPAFQSILHGRRTAAAAVLAALALYGTGIAPEVQRLYVNVVQGTRNIYEQHYQLGRFFSTLPEGTAIAANDIGAISFFGKTRLLDIMGLGSPAVVRSRLRHTYSNDELQRFMSSAAIKYVAAYVDWFQHKLITNDSAPPGNWIPVGQWKINDVVVAGGDVVTFFGVDASSAAELKERLRLFAASLPAGVEQGGPYMGRPWLRDPLNGLATGTKKAAKSE